MLVVLMEFLGKRVVCIAFEAARFQSQSGEAEKDKKNREQLN